MKNIDDVVRRANYYIISSLSKSNDISSDDTLSELIQEVCNSVWWDARDKIYMELFECLGEDE